MQNASQPGLHRGRSDRWARFFMQLDGLSGSLEFGAGFDDAANLAEARSRAARIFGILWRQPTLVQQPTQAEQLPLDLPAACHRPSGCVSFPRTIPTLSCTPTPTPHHHHHPHPHLHTQGGRLVLGREQLLLWAAGRAGTERDAMGEQVLFGQLVYN